MLNNLIALWADSLRWSVQPVLSSVSGGLSPAGAQEGKATC